jgi:restriction system protein
MAVPKYFEMYQSFFRALADRKEHPYIDVKNQVIKDFGLSADDVSELLPSGRQSVFNNRIGWCRTYLKKAGLIESPSRAHFAITNAGKKIYDTVDVITNDTLRSFPSFVEFVGGDVAENSPMSHMDNGNTDETPQETLERVHGELNKVLIDGQKLAQLMIEYDFGVSTEYVYKVKKIDSDLFEEE